MASVGAKRRRLIPGEFRPVNSLDGSTSHPTGKRRIALSPIPPSTPKRRKQDAQRHSDADSDIVAGMPSEPRRHSPSIQSSSRDSSRGMLLNQGEYRQCESNALGRHQHRPRRHRKRASGDGAARPLVARVEPSSTTATIGAQSGQQRWRRRPVEVSDEGYVDVDASDDGDGASVSEATVVALPGPPKKINTEISVVLPVSKQRFRNRMDEGSNAKAKRPMPSSPPSNDGLDELSTEYYPMRPLKRSNQRSIDDDKPSDAKAAPMSTLVANIVESPLRVRAAVRTPMFTYACGSTATEAPAEELELTLDPQQPRLLVPADKISFWLRVDLREARMISTHTDSPVVLVDLPEKQHASGRLGSRLGIRFHSLRDARRLKAWASELESGTGFKMREGTKLDKQFEYLVDSIESRRPLSAEEGAVDLSVPEETRPKRPSPDTFSSGGVQSKLPSRTRSGRAGRALGRTADTVVVDAPDETPAKGKDGTPETTPASTDSRLARLRNRNARTRSSLWSSFEDAPVERWTEKHPDWARNWRVPLTYSRTTVDKDDVVRLDEGQFLNDNIINFYLQFMQATLKMSDSTLASRVYFHNTFFYEKLKPSRGHAISFDGIKRWTAKVDLFSYDYIVVPVNDQLHWWVAIICNVPKILEAAIPPAPGGANDDEVGTPQASRTEANVENDKTIIDDRPSASAFSSPKTKTPMKASTSSGLHSPLVQDDGQAVAARVDEAKSSSQGEEFAIVLKSVERDEDGDSQAQRATNGEEATRKESTQPPRVQGSSSQTKSAAVDVDNNDSNAATAGADDDDDIEVTEIRSDLAAGTAKTPGTPAKKPFAGGRSKKQKVFIPSSKNRDPKDPRIFTLDSLGSPHSAAVDHLKQWLMAEIAARKEIQPLDPGRLGMTAKAIPEQENFCDCGVYLLLYIQEFIKDPDGFIEDIVLRRERKWDTAASDMRSQLRELILHKQEEFQAIEEANKKPKKRPAVLPAAKEATPPVTLPRAGASATKSIPTSPATPTTPAARTSDRMVPNSQSLQESSSPRRRSPSVPTAGPDKVDPGGYESPAEVDMVFRPISNARPHEDSSAASSLAPMEPFVSSPLERTSPAPYDLPGHPQQG